MQKLILQRFLQAILAMLAVTLIVFFSARLTGDPLMAMLDPNATEEDFARAREYYGLDKPLATQYWIFISEAAKGDFGKSIRTRRSVNELISERLPASLQLAGVAMLISTLVAVPIGVLTAVKRDTVFDVVGKIFAVFGQSMPVFWLGILLIVIFAVALRWFPPAGRGGVQNIILPAVTLGWYHTAGIMRLLRSSMLDALDGEYVKLARIKGVTESVVVWKHCLKNAALPVITFAGVMFSQMLAGSVITETVFAWPGIGALAIDSFKFRDFPVIQAVVLLYTAIFLAVNFFVDLAYVYLDPRIRYGE